MADVPVQTVPPAGLEAVTFQAAEPPERYLDTVGGFASTPDRADGAFHGDGIFVSFDLDVRIHVELADWTPSALTTWFIGQGSHTLGDDLAWTFTLHNNGALRMAITEDGDNFFGPTSDIPGFVDGTDHWLRCTVDMDDGSGGTTFTYYESLDDGETWDVIGAPIQSGPGGVVGTTSLYDSADVLRVPGEASPGQLNQPGSKVFYAEVRKGIEGEGASLVVANPDFVAQAPGTTKFQDTQGVNSNMWTLQGAAAIRGGDRVPTHPRTALLIRNTDASAHTATVETPGTVGGLAIADAAVTVAAGALAVVPMSRTLYGPRALVTYDDATGAEVAAVSPTS